MLYEVITGGEHLVEARLFDVEDLPLERQDRLVTAVASLLGAPPRRVPLDEIDFAQGRVLLLAVGELAGEG